MFPCILIETKTGNWIVEQSKYGPIFFLTHCIHWFFGEVNTNEKNNVIYIKKLVQARIKKK